MSSLSILRLQKNYKNYFFAGIFNLKDRSLCYVSQIIVGVKFGENKVGSHISLSVLALCAMLPDSTVYMLKIEVCIC